MHRGLQNDFCPAHFSAKLCSIFAASAVNQVTAGERKVYVKFRKVKSTPEYRSETSF